MEFYKEQFMFVFLWQVGHQLMYKWAEVKDTFPQSSRCVEAVVCPEQRAPEEKVS